MTQKASNIFASILFYGLLASVVFVLGWLARGDYEDANPPKVTTDTLIGVKTDTSRHVAPKPIIKDSLRIDTLYITIRDSIPVPVPIQIERKVYQSEEYHAEISGFRPVLECIEVYPKTITKTVTNTVQSYKDWKGMFTAGAYADVMYSADKVVPAIGLSTGIRYNKLALDVRGGVMYIDALKPYAGISLRYDFALKRF